MTRISSSKSKPFIVFGAYNRLDLGSIVVRQEPNSPLKNILIEGKFHIYSLKDLALAVTLFKTTFIYLLLLSTSRFFFQVLYVKSPIHNLNNPFIVHSIPTFTSNLIFRIPSTFLISLNMSIVDDEVLKELTPWVESTLNELVDSDVDILSNYIFSLLKHDLPMNELSKLCKSQLQDFLRNDTDLFVDELIKGLQMVLEYKNEQVKIKPQPQSQPQPQSLPQSQQQSQSESQPSDNSSFHGQAKLRQSFRPERKLNLQYNDNNFNDNTTYRDQTTNIFIPHIPPPFSMDGTASPEYIAFIQAQQMQQNLVHNFPPNIIPNGKGKRDNKSKNQDIIHSKDNLRYTSPLSGKNIENDFSNTKVILEKIPEDKFNKDSIMEYFSRFGNILNLTLHQKYKVAELEYEYHEQARAAYESPDPIFNNRFVKIFWKRTVDTPKLDIEAITRIQKAKQQEFEEKRAKRLEHEQKMKEILDLKQKILREQTEILYKQASKSSNVDGKPEIEGALRSQLAALRAEAESLGIDSTTTATTTTSIRGRGGRWGSRGRGGIGRGRGRGRGGAYHPYAARQSYSIDLRSKTILIKPIPQDKRGELQHYLLDTPYDNIRSSPDESGFVVDFKDRASAELFLNKTRSIPDIGPVEVSWSRPSNGYSGNKNYSASPEAMELN